MIQKRAARLRRAGQTRRRVHQQKAMRLSVHRTNSHIYAQIFSAEGDKVLASASTAEKDLRGKLPSGGGKAAASIVGQRIAEKAKVLGIGQVAFDRAGYKYHGRIKALADAAREAGLKF